MPLWDPSHRGWNDLKLATQDASLWSSMLVLTIAANCFFGPWNGSKFWQESKEGLEAFLEVASQDDPLFQSMLPGMLQDEGLLHTQTDQEVAADMFEGLRANMRWEERPEDLSGQMVWFLRWAEGAAGILAFQTSGSYLFGCRPGVGFQKSNPGCLVQAWQGCRAQAEPVCCRLFQ